jgi:xylitol oxidase
LDVTNWAGNVVFGVDRVYRPSSIDELQGLVARSRRVRVLGSGHSFNEIADTDGVLVSVESIPSPPVVDQQTATVTVGAGVRYGELARSLHTAGLALPNMASLPHISVGGAVATGTHGSGNGNGSLATAVSALELVTGEGKVVTLRRDADGDRFGGAVVALGAMGVVTSLTLDVVPTFEVRQWVYDGLGWDALTVHLDEIFAGGYSVSVFSGWGEQWDGQVLVKRHAADTREAETELYGARLADAERHPIHGMPAEYCTPQMGVPGPWFERLPHFRAEFTPSAGAELQSEYLVPRESAVAALEALAGVRDRFRTALLVGELRTIAADELWLSPFYGHDMFGFHFTWVKETDVVYPAIRAVEEALVPFETRPHWGKLFTMAHDVVRSRYPRLEDFDKLAGQLDPDGKFRNGFIDRFVVPQCA